MNESGKVRIAKPNLYLIGYRGSGKSTLAPVLATQLGFRCVDTDALLEEHFGEPISKFFAHHGEAEFRRQESLLVQTIGDTPNQVISLGGGSVLDPKNQDAIRRTGMVVWLSCPIGILASRLTRDQTLGTGRPSLTGRGVVEEIELVLKAREPIYRSLADLIVEDCEAAPDKIAQQVALWWKLGQA